MKIAIHHREGSFSDQWVQYCKKNDIKYILVNAYCTDIIKKLRVENVTHFMWHINHASYKDLMVFHYVMNSIESIGIHCFPDFKTRWHFDDKIAQKYLLESIDAPIVPSYVFYERDDALRYIENSQFPIVAKLRRGAGASNVKLLKSVKDAIPYISKMFTTGIRSNAGVLGNFDQKFRLVKKVKSPILLIKKVISFIRKNNKEIILASAEKGYFYFQKFIPNNDYDIRLIVVSNKFAYGLRRVNRPNDFRASGSSIFRYDNIPKEVVKVAFETSRKLSLQSCAFDFIFDESNNPLIIEMSFGFGTTGSSKAPGYWTSDLEWHEERFNSQEWMIEDLIESREK